MSNVILKETASKASLGKVQGKRRWLTRVISVGAGSSGIYTESALRDTGPAAFPVGTQVHINHDSWRDEDERPEGDLRRLAGVLVSAAEFKEDGLYAEIEFGEEWGPFVEQFHDFIGLSIAAYGYHSEVSETGLPIIEGFIPSPTNRVDLVTLAGAKGKVIEALESFRGKLEVNNGKETGMTPEQIAELTEAIVVGLTPALTALQEALTPEVTDDTEVNDDVAAVTEALVESELPKVARAKVYEAVQGGTAVADAIAEQKAFIESLRAGDEENEGAIKESGKPAEAAGRIRVQGW